MNKYIKFSLVSIMLFGANSNNCYSMEDNNIGDIIHNARLQYLNAIKSFENSFSDINNTLTNFISEVYETYHFLFLRTRWICEYLNNSESNEAKQIAVNLYDNVRNFVVYLQDNLRQYNINNIYNVIAIENYIMDKILESYNIIKVFIDVINHDLGKYDLSPDNFKYVKETIQEILNMEEKFLQLKHYITQNQH